jgi:hypothetical protein
MAAPTAAGKSYRRNLEAGTLRPMHLNPAGHPLRLYLDKWLR